MGRIFSKIFSRTPKIDSNKLAKEYWSKKQDDALSTLNEEQEKNQEHELQTISPQNIHQQEQEVMQTQEIQEKETVESNQQQLYQEEQTQQQQTYKSEPQQEKHDQQQESQENIEKITITQQFQEESIIQQDNPEIIIQESKIVEDPEVEHKWLARTFGIKTMQKKIKNIPEGLLTVDIVSDKLLYTILTSHEYQEEFKCFWLIEKLSQLSQVEFDKQYALVDEGEIILSKFEKIMDSVLNYLIQGVVHPQRLQWKIQIEIINNIDDVSNQKADIVFDSIFVKSFSIFSFGSKELTFLLQFLETKANIHDSHSFMDYMFKRELRNLKLTLNTEYERPLVTLKFLQTIVNYPKLTESLLINSWAFGRFDQIVIGKQFASNSIVGQILSISGFIVQGRNLVELMARLKQSNQQINNGKRCFLIIDEFTTLFKSILRKGPHQALFKYFSKIIELNLNLEKLRNEQLFWECSPPGMIFNLQQILLAIINPWINSNEKLNKSIQNVDFNLMASIKKHPLLKPLYQGLPQIAPETTPYIINQVSEQDKLTMIFLLTQRVNHIIATFIDQVYIAEILSVLDITKQEFGMDSEHYCLFLKLKIDFDATYLDQVSMSNTMQFLSFASQLAVKLLDKDNKPIYPYGLLSESFLRDIHTFITIYNENLESLNLEQEILSCCEYIILTLNHRNLVANPHLRIKGIELFNLIDKSASIRKSGVKKALANTSFALNQNIQVNLIPGWFKAFSDSEISGFGIQFFDKFNIRSKYCKFLRFILEKHFEILKNRIKQTFIRDKEQFTIFLGFHLDDLQYLLDECIKKLRLSKQIEDEFDLGQQNRKLEYLQNERELNEQVTFLTEYYDTLQVLSQISPDAFLIEEMKDKLVNYLIFTLYSLNDPLGQKLLCRSMKTINFDHRRIIIYVIGLFINLSQNDQFLQQVIKDERFFSISLLQNTINNLDNQILPKQRATKFIQIIQKLKILQEEQEQLNQILIDIPDEFIDPLVTTLMSDPVMLPSSKMVLDRVTIKKQLLNSSQDPFDRSYLTIEMLIEQPDLKQKIEDYIKGKKEQISKQKMNQQQQ